MAANTVGLNISAATPNPIVAAAPYQLSVNPTTTAATTKMNPNATIATSCPPGPECGSAGVPSGLTSSTSCAICCESPGAYKVVIGTVCSGAGRDVCDSEATHCSGSLSRPVHPYAANLSVRARPVHEGRACQSLPVRKFIPQLSSRDEQSIRPPSSGGRHSAI